MEAIDNSTSNSISINRSTDFVMTALNDSLLVLSWVYLTMSCQSLSPDPIQKIPLQLWFVLGILYIGLLCMHLLLIFHWMLRVALILFTSIYMAYMVDSLVIARVSMNSLAGREPNPPDSTQPNPLTSNLVGLLHATLPRDLWVHYHLCERKRKA